MSTTSEKWKRNLRSLSVRLKEECRAQSGSATDLEEALADLNRTLAADPELLADLNRLSDNLDLVRHSMSTGSFKKLRSRLERLIRRRKSASSGIEELLARTARLETGAELGGLQRQLAELCDACEEQDGSRQMLLPGERETLNSLHRVLEYLRVYLHRIREGPILGSPWGHQIEIDALVDGPPRPGLEPAGTEGDWKGTLIDLTRRLEELYEGHRHYCAQIRERLDRLNEHLTAPYRRIRLETPVRNALDKLEGYLDRSQFRKLEETVDRTLSLSLSGEAAAGVLASMSVLFGGWILLGAPYLKAGLGTAGAVALALTVYYAFYFPRSLSPEQQAEVAERLLGERSSSYVEWRASHQLRRAAQAGIARAQLQLGRLYLRGRGVKRDDAEAAKWVRKATEQGNPEAMLTLADLYSQGRGVEEKGARAKQLRKKAIRQYRPAAQNGDVDAQFRLGRIHQNRPGSRHNDTAAEWYRSAAEQGHAFASFNLARLHHNGDGIERDPGLAETLFQTAEQQLRELAEKKVDGAYYLLGLIHRDGLGVDRDMEEGLKCLEQAAETDHIAAQRDLGTMLLYGEGIDRDPERGFELVRGAAERGDSDAMCQAGLCLDDGLGTGRDLEKAADWYREAAALGNPYAQYRLGEFYQDGIVVEQSSPRTWDLYSSAAEGFRKLADQQDSEAMNMLGLHYELGRGVENDPERAKDWYRKAADLGNPEAMKKPGQVILRRQGCSPESFACYRARRASR